MQVNLTGHHVYITDALRDYVDEKMARLDRHFDHVSNLHVIVSVEKLKKKAEATGLLAGADVVADSVHEDMYAAIDALVDKLDRQVRSEERRVWKEWFDGWAAAY